MDFTDILSQALSNRVNQAMEPFNDPQAYAQQRLGITTATNQTNEMPAVAGPAVPNTPTAYTSPVSTPNITTKELPQLPYLAAQNQPGLAEAPPGTGPDMRMTGPEVEPQARTRSLSGAVALEPVTTATVQQPQLQPAPQPQPAQPPKPQAPKLNMVVNANNPAETSDPLFNSIIQNESGGRHFDKNGNIITSSAGAMGLAQIMPATARNPGFGLKPLSEEDIKDPVKNAAFGLQYFNAQKRYFNGDEEKAVAAYNAGAGNVNKAIKMAQQQGGEWRDYLPAETKAYLPKVMTGRKAIEGAVAEHIEKTTGERSTELQGAGMRMPGGGTVEQYQALNSKDPEQLTKLIYGLSTPPSVQRQALEQLHSDIKYQNTMNKIEAEFPSIASNPTAITRKMNDKEEGSYFKAYLFARLGLTELAQMEQRKIRPDFKFAPVTLGGGEQYSVKFNKNTNEVEGANDSQGRPVTDEKKLGQIAAQAMTASQIGQSGATFYRDSKGQQWAQIPTEQGPRFQNINTGLIGTPTGNIVPIQGGTDVELQNQLQLQKNRNKLDLLSKELKTRLEYIPAQEHNKFVAKFNAENGTSYGFMAGPNGTKQLVENAPAPQANAPAPQAATGQAPAPQAPTTRGAAPAPQATAPQTANAVMTEAPKPMPGETPAAFKARIEAYRKSASEIAKESGKTVAGSADTQNLINTINKSVDILDSGDHNVGSALSVVAGRGPIAQAIGQQFETKDSINTMYILDTVNKLATEGLRVLGPNPSNADRDFWTANKPGQGSSPEYMKMWIESRRDDLKRRLGYAERQTGAGGAAGVAPAVGSSNQWKIISVEPGR